MVNRAAQASDVIWRRIGEEVVVIKDDGLSTHVLNKTAAFIWETCNSGHSVEEITSKVCECFEVSSEHARTDVIEIIDKFIQAGIMNRIEETAGS